jgi:hypothetical protein
VRSPPAKLGRPTCSVHRVRARVRSATASSSSPPYSIRGVVLRCGVRRGPGNFAGDPSVPSHQARGAPPGQGPLHRTPAYPRANDKTATPFPLRPSRTKADSRLGPLHRTPAYPRANDKTATPFPLRPSRTKADSRLGLLHRTPAYPRTNDKTATQRRADAAPTHRPRTGTAVRTRARHTGVSTYDGRVFAHLLHRAEKPALRHGPCRRYPRTPPHAHAHACTRTCAR